MFVHVIRFVWEGPGVDSFVALQFQTGLGLVGGVFFFLLVISCYSLARTS